MGNQQALILFQSKVESLTETDYGDFKRKVGQYLSRLLDSLDRHTSPEVKRKLDEIKHYVVYQPSGDVDQTRLRLHQDITQLLPLVAHS